MRPLEWPGSGSTCCRSGIANDRLLWRLGLQSDCGRFHTPSHNCLQHGHFSAALRKPRAVFLSCKVHIKIRSGRSGQTQDSWKISIGVKFERRMKETSGLSWRDVPSAYRNNRTRSVSGDKNFPDLVPIVRNSPDEPTGFTSQPASKPSPEKQKSQESLKLEIAILFNCRYFKKRCASTVQRFQGDPGKRSIKCNRRING